MKNILLILICLLGFNFSALAWAGDDEENNSEQALRDQYYYTKVLDLTSRSPEVRNTAIQELQKNVPDARYALRQVLQKTPHENVLLRAQAAWMHGLLGINPYDVMDRSLGLPSVLPIELHEALRDSHSLVRSSAQQAFEYIGITPDEEQILWKSAQRKKEEERIERINETDRRVREMLVDHFVDGKPWDIEECKTLLNSLPEEKQAPIREALNAALRRIEKIQ